MREISNRIATSGNSKQERDKKGCGRDGRDRRNPIARITDKYERLERSSGSHPPSTISPLSLHSILGYVISCRNSFFFLEGGNNRKRLDAFPRGPIRLEWNCVYPYKSMKLQDTFLSSTCYQITISLQIQKNSEYFSQKDILKKFIEFHPLHL